MTDALQAPIVSAIVSTYNAAKFIRGCIEDLERQTIADQLEIIVIDSASPQNEGEIVRELQERYQNIRYLRTEQRETVYAAWNRAIGMARGRYITNANTDDRHRRDAFEVMVKTLDALPDVDLVYADVLITRLANETFETTAASDSYTWPAWDRPTLLDKGCFIGPQPMWRRSVHDRYGGFDASYVTSGDYEFWLRISQTSNFQHIAQPLGLYLARPDSIEHANEAVKQRENAAIRRIYREAAAQGRLVGLVEQQPLQMVVREASRLAQRGEVDGAVRLLLDQGIRVAKHDPAPYVALTEILISASRYHDAVEVLPEMPTDTDQALKHELAATCYCALGDNAAALQAALQAEGRPRVQVVLGALAARQGDLVGAEQFFRQAVATDFSCGSGWLSLGMLLWGQGQQAEAWQVVKRAVTVEPLNQEAVSIMCDMAERLNQQLDAVAILASALDIHPDCRHLALQKAVLSAKAGVHNEALAACEEFLVRFGADDSLLVLASELRQQAGIYDRLMQGGEGSISLCMIVKDEEACLARCLASVKPAVHELVVVDTGSSDRTVAIATAFGARVLSFPWNGSFADARNYALEQAHGTWILVLDADEVISGCDYEVIRSIVRGGSSIAWSVTTRNYTDRHPGGWVANDGSYPEDERGQGWYPSAKVRLFPNNSMLRFNGDVHEMVEKTAEAAGFQIETAAFVVHHYGELCAKPERLLDKKNAYYELGRQKLAEQPYSLPAIGELAVQAAELGRFDEALELWDRFLALQPDAVVALFNKGFVLICLGRYSEALAVSQRVLKLEPQHKEAVYNYGVCELYVGDADRALGVVVPMATRYPDHPLLKALWVALACAAGHSGEVDALVQGLRADGYAIDAYLRDRAAVLQRCGRAQLSETLMLKVQGI